MQHKTKICFSTGYSDDVHKQEGEKAKCKGNGSRVNANGSRGRRSSRHSIRLPSPSLDKCSGPS
eukprot:5956828-Amphidinium_carterae.1